MSRPLFLSIVFIAVFPVLLHGQTESVPAEIAKLNTSDRISLQQIDQLIESKSWEQAVDEIMRLMDSGRSRLIRFDTYSPKAAGFECWVPIDLYLKDRLMRWEVSVPELTVAYRRRADAPVKLELKRCQSERDFHGVRRLIRDSLATSYGDQVRLLYADLAIEHGWLHSARAAVEAIDPRLRATGVADSVVATVSSVTWADLRYWFPEPSDRELAGQLRGKIGLPLGSYRGSDLPIRGVALRLPYCSYVAGEFERARRESDLLKEVFHDQEVSESENSFLQSLSRASALPKKEAAVRLSHRPKWTKRLKPLSSLVESNTGHLPSGETLGQQIAYLPTVWNGRVFLHEADRINGYDLATGSRWPVDDSDFSLLTFGDSLKEIMPPKGLPISGWPRFSASVDNGFLVARLGPPVTGWLPVIRKSDGSASQIAALDLGTDGRLLDAYPRALGQDLNGFEVEGSPLVRGDSIFLGVTRRDGSTYESRVISIDLRTGVRKWMSGNLSISAMLSERDENRVTHSRLTFREGSLFYHASLGTVASIDAESGFLNWLHRYPRGELAGNRYRKPRLAQSRDLTEVMLEDDKAIVVTADCDRIFALDAQTGQLLWATGVGQGGDVNCLVGARGEHVIASGDRLYWINKHSGRFAAAFPAGSTQVEGGGRDASRGAGRGTLVGDRVFWSNRTDMFVFDADLPDVRVGTSPAIVDRIDLRAKGLVGGDLLASEDYLLLTCFDSMSVFEFLVPPER